MAYLLRRSLFTDTKKKDIRASLAQIELKAQTSMWNSTSAIFKGTLIAGVFLENLFARSKEIPIYLLPAQQSKICAANDALLNS